MEPGRLSMRRAALLLAPLGLAAALGACKDEAPPPVKPVETEVPKELAQARPVRPAVASEGATPMAKRVATIGLLNKRNNLEQDLQMKPGDTQRVGDVIVRLQACERTAPWEFPKQTGAFVQVFVRSAGPKGQFAKIFSGWLFKESPGLNVVEHPIYDVWVKDCKMSFSGDSAPAAASSDKPAKSTGSGGASPAPSPTPTPEASPSNVT
jgi:hypothetical protein